MDNYQDEFRRILDEELGDYARLSLQLLAASIQAKGLVLTEDLLQSLHSEVAAATAQHVASMGLAFEEYGRIKEMKATSRTKAPPIAAMEAYVKKVGINNFDYVPGYGRNARPVGLGRTINRIAWGLARAQLRDHAAVRPRPWFAKTFYSSINRFIDAVTTRYLAATGTHLAATLKI